MPRFSTQYKPRGPMRRTVSGETSYEKGMFFDDSTLQPGYVNTLLNLEIDQLNYTIHTTGGLHTADIASGCNFLDRAKFGQDSKQIVVLQGRNEYCARAFEGITNIIGVQRLAVKSNQTLAEQIRQQGFTANDVVCYKILTYNPINYRLMSVTLIQAERDKYFIVSPDYSLRRIQVNPISCGSSRVWEKANGDPYVSNITDFHPNGADDNYIPRARRNVFDETFGQVLHSSHHMQTVPNCEGFGNKTFLFTNKKQIKITGPIIDQRIREYMSVYSIVGFRAKTKFFKVADVITIKPDRDLDSKEKEFVIKVFAIDTENESTLVNVDWIDHGAFKWNGKAPDTSFKITVTRGDTDVTSSIVFEQFAITRFSVGSLLINTIIPTRNTQEDIYLRNCNTGADRVISDSKINNVPVPVDSFRFGIVLTSIALLVDNSITPLSTTVDPLELYSTALISPIKSAGTTNADKNIPSLEIDLNKGLLRATSESGKYSFKALTPIRGTDLSVNNPVDIETGLFKPESFSEQTWFHPAKYIDQSIIDSLRVGQGFRFAVYAKSAVSLTRNLNTVHDNPLKSEYYDERPVAVWVLDYVWNGVDWEFSFVDTRKLPDIANPTLIENWECNSTTLDAYRNRITRHFIWINCLSYTDIITKENQSKMANHLVDEELSTRQLFNRSDNKLIGSSEFGLLTYNLDETLDERIGIEEFDNKSKLFDTAYGHFIAEPRNLQPSEASLWGYNMLSPTPYLFKCEDRPGFEPMLTGVLLMKNNQPLLKPLVNTEGVLFIYFNSDAAYTATMDPAKYQLKIEYKNQYDEWRTLKTYSIGETHMGLSSSKPFEVPFTSPDEVVMIRLEITDTLNFIKVANTSGEMVDQFLVVSTIISTLNYTKDPTQIETAPKVFDLGSALGITYWKSRLVAWGVLGAESTLFLSEASQPEYWPYPNNIDLFEENIVHVIPYSDALIVFTSTKLWRIDLNADGLSWRKTLLQQNLRIIDKDIPYICILKNMLFFKSDKQFYMLVPSRSSTVGDLTIAPISRPIADFLKNPFKAIKSLVPAPFKELACGECPINEYLVKYGAHVEQMRIYIDWWFDYTSFKNKVPHVGSNEIEHEVIKQFDKDDNPTLLEKEYWLVQLVYDAQTYSWSLRTHTTNKIGSFISDAANTDTDFVSLVFNPEITKSDGTPMFVNNEEHYSKATWGISIAHRRTPEESLLQQFTLESTQTKALKPTYPRFQILDTGYKEVSNPALNKRFREVQIYMEPLDSEKIESQAPEDYLEQLIGNNVPDVAEAPELITPYMSSNMVEPITGDAVALKALVDVFVDGNQMLISTCPEVSYELQTDNTLQIKITDVYNFIEGPFTVDAELSNTFMLDKSAFSGVKLIRFRKTLNGKGQLIRMRFTNLTESNYSIVGHSFVSHNKNAR